MNASASNAAGSRPITKDQLQELEMLALVLQNYHLRNGSLEIMDASQRLLLIVEMVQNKPPLE